MRLKTSLPTLSIARTLSIASAMALLPGVAMAHPGHGHTAGFLDGVNHPLSGIDHMFAMVLVGLFAVQLGGRATWALPATFIAAMALGSVAGVAGIAPSIVELGIGLSVVVLGVMVAMQARLPVLAAMALVGAIALVHGHAHGAEADGFVSLAYVAGFLASTALLLAGGIAAGLAFGRAAGRAARLPVRIAGGLAAVAGLFLTAG